MQGDEPNAGAADGTLGRIALKQVRMSRAEAEARSREASSPAQTQVQSQAQSQAQSPTPAQTPASRKSANPMNRLVPYLDLFCRLSDEELSRLARAPISAVENLRQQVHEVNRALGRYIDLLPRLSDDELARLTGATTKTIRFWRLSQPRHLQGDARRLGNADLTPTPQPIPQPIPQPGDEISSSQPRREPVESGTFVVDT
jgi:hypothetical protein